jgi:hypothetical protein
MYLENAQGQPFGSFQVSGSSRSIAISRTTGKRRPNKRPVSTTVTFETEIVFLGQFVQLDLFGALLNVLVQTVRKNVMTWVDWTLDALPLISLQVQVIPTVLF